MGKINTKNKRRRITIQYPNREMLHINSSSPSAAYMHQRIGSVLVQIMACRSSGRSHYLNQYCDLINWTSVNKLSWKFNHNTKLFIHENASENIVCEMAASCPGGDELLGSALRAAHVATHAQQNFQSNSDPIIFQGDQHSHLLVAFSWISLVACRIQCELLNKYRLCCRTMSFKRQFVG